MGAELMTMIVWMISMIFIALPDNWMNLNDMTDKYYYAYQWSWD